MATDATDPSAPAARLPRPDLSGRPHSFTVERVMAASPGAIFRAWTERFDNWFARPGVIRMRARVEEPFYFEVEHEGVRHAHYGRFLELEPDQVIELTWMTGKGGTDGAETVVRVELAPVDAGTRLRLTHSGFYDEAAAAQHEVAWPRVLAHLDERSAGTSPTTGETSAGMVARQPALPKFRRWECSAGPFAGGSLPPHRSGGNGTRGGGSLPPERGRWARAEARRRRA